VTTDEKIQAAYDALTAGRPGSSDGQLTVSNICLEAGISRASFYRSTLAATIRRDLAGPGTARRPDAEQLRAKVRELTAADKQHAASTQLRSATCAPLCAPTPTTSRS